MKVVNYEIEVIEDNCTGCYLCENICPTKAIVLEGPKSSAIAKVDNDTCVACFRCVDICDDDALLAHRREQPITFGFDTASVDPVAINELIQRSGVSPTRPICPCSLTSAQEVAASIIGGAQTMQDLALQTGVQSGCLMYCFAPVHRMLTTYLGHDLESPRKNQFYNTSTNIFDVSADIAAAYPQFHIAEEQCNMRREQAAALAVAGTAPTAAPANQED
jgi:ferredoxin